MLHKKFFLVLVCISWSICYAQYDAPLYTSYTTEAARARVYDRVVNNIITKNLAQPLTDSTEFIWEDAFNAMQVYDFKNAYTHSKMAKAFDSAIYCSMYFQRALLEVAYALYPGEFNVKAQQILENTQDPKIFAMAAEYLLQSTNSAAERQGLLNSLNTKFADSVFENPTLFVLKNRLQPVSKNERNASEVLPALLDKNFLAGATVIYSFQRKNRDYPGMLIIRKSNGEFLRDEAGNIFHIPQLARSITNLPYYLRNGNTPQGIFRMFGFEVSRNLSIGPTANVQLGLPVELSKKKYFGDSSLLDSTWNLNDYKKLLPASISNYFPLYEAYYAGLTGRNEIIAHGTTVDPKLYEGKPYFPFTPTMGCLCTMEIWNGARKKSDQQKLVNGLLAAGSSFGYTVVFDLDDTHAPVSIGDLSQYIK